VISYRHHVVSLVAVFLALAVGVALGGGPLSELGRDDTPVSAQVRAREQVAQRESGFGDDFAAAAAEKLYAGRLKDHPVSILTMPGADGDVVSALAAQVEAAGGKVAGTYDAEPALVSASEKSLVDTLGSQLMTQLDDGAVDTDASTYDRIGQLLGVAVSGDTVSTDEANSIRQSLAGAELVTSPDGAGRAPLMLVVLGDEGADDAILSGLLSGLATTTTGVVVAGDTVSGIDGDLHGLRGEPVADEVATVDSADTGVGQVTAVLALARSLQVQGGSFGASGSDGAVPLG
jgi:hypothetical protein